MPQFINLNADIQYWFETYFYEEYDHFVEDEDCYEERKKDMEDALRTHNQQYFQREVDDYLESVLNIENESFTTAISRTIDYDELIKALIEYIYVEHDVAVVEWVKERNE
jgi:hypothetical protein